MQVTKPNFHHSSNFIHVLHLQVTMFYSCQHLKQIDHPFNFYLWTHDSNNCFAWKPTFGNWPSWMHHQASGFAHVNGGIKNLLNKNNFLLINVHEISLIETPTPNIFSLRSNLTTSTTIIIHALTIGFNHSKHTIKKGTTTLISYLDVNQIAFSRPTKFFTTQTLE